MIAVCIYAVFKYLLPVLFPFVLAYGIAYMLAKPVRRIAGKIRWKSAFLPTVFQDFVFPFLEEGFAWIEGLFILADPSGIGFLEGSFENILTALSSGILSQADSGEAENHYAGGKGVFWRDSVKMYCVLWIDFSYYFSGTVGRACHDKNPICHDGCTGYRSIGHSPYIGNGQCAYSMGLLGWNHKLQRWTFRFATKVSGHIEKRIGRSYPAILREKEETVLHRHALQLWRKD